VLGIVDIMEAYPSRTHDRRSYQAFRSTSLVFTDSEQSVDKSRL